MKNSIYYLIVSILFAGIMFTSCGDTDDYLTNSVLTENLEKGGLVRFDNLNPFTPVVDINDFISGAFDEVKSIYDPNNNLQSISYDVIASISGVTDTVTNALEFNSFPFDMQLNSSVLASIFGINPTDFAPGDEITFVGTAVRSDGVEFSLDNTNQVLADDARGGYVHAMNFNISLACEFKPEEAVGNYIITNDPFGTSLDYSSPIEAVINEDGTGVIFKDLFRHPEMYDVEVVFTSATLGLVEVERQAAWHCDNFGCPYGEGRVDGTGTFFTCVGVLNVNLQHTVDLGSFGTFNLVLEKL